MTGQTKRHKTINLLQEFSIPLVAGVVAALLFANWDAQQYHHLTHAPLVSFFGTADAGVHGTSGGWWDFLTLHFLVNDLFMALFFGIAAKEITEACLPGGALNPASKAINPLFATIGGVVGPVGVFLLLNAMIGSTLWTSGWGIPTATDIALAWLVARLVFGKGHPAISFLLLLAVADDAIGLAIIAIAYPSPDHPTLWANTLWILPGMATAYGLRRAGVKSWIPYIACGGALSWHGLHSAHLHPALALVFIVPFLPGPKRDMGIFVEPVRDDPLDNGLVPASSVANHDDPTDSPLQRFEHQLKLPVDFGLFFFAFANAGVAFSDFSNLTWIVLASLIAGKMLGITTFSLLAERLGFALPVGMRTNHVVVVGVIAGLGLTVALFVSGQAYTDPALQGAAKMGALLSVGALFLAAVMGWALNVRDVPRASDAPWLAWKWPGRKSVSMTD